MGGGKERLTIVPVNREGRSFDFAAGGVAVVYVKMTKVYVPISELVLYVAFERGDLSRF